MENITENTKNHTIAQTSEAIKNITQRFNQQILNYDFTAHEDNCGLFEGHLGIVYYLQQISNIEQNEALQSKMSELLNFVFEKVMQGNNVISISTSFSFGLSGLGYISNEFIKKGILDDDINEFLDDIDDYIVEDALKEIEKKNFDFMEGAIGALYYLSNRPNKKYSIVIDHMHQLLGSTTYPFYNHITELFNKGVNFGIAHGIVGLLIVMLEIHEKNSEDKKVMDIIEHCLDIILKSKRKGDVNGKTTFYPYNIFYNDEGRTSYHPTNRLAWCSGDLAVSLALYKAGKILKRQDCINIADLLGHACLQRKTIEETGIHLPIFCHGTSGAAILYKRIFELSGNQIYHDEFNYWKTRTLELFESETFKTANYDHFNMLLGLTGAILMLNNENNELAHWEKLFLI